jgi:phosphohistidine phosphatase
VKLFLIRHGPAVPAGTKGIADADRTLTPEGRKKTLQAMRGLKRLDPGITSIYSSPLPRAFETAEILARLLEGPKIHATDRLLPGASVDEFLALVRQAKGEGTAFVGHEPNLSSALAVLIGADDTASYEFKKAGAALVFLTRRSPRPAGTLRLFLPPSVLRAIAR